MSEYVTDTHALVWHLTQSKKLSQTAWTIFEGADAGWHRIFVPGIVLVELVFLIEKHRLDKSLFTRTASLLNTLGGSYALALLDVEVAQAVQEIDRAAVLDMPDRIIAATAMRMGLPLLSRDGAISGVASLNVIW